MPPVTMTESYIWRVTYQDGTTLDEYPDPDTHRSFTEVQVGDVVLLEVMPNPYLGKMGPTYTVRCDPNDGVRPVMFRRVAVNTRTGETARWHVFGWQCTAPARHHGNVKSLAYLSETDGTVVMADRDLEVR